MNKTINNYVMAEDLFSSLSDESKQPKNKKIKIFRNSTLNKLHKEFKKLLTNESILFRYIYYDLENILGFDYSSEDIKQFSFELKKYDKTYKFKGYAGIFLSCLINTCNEDEFIINTTGLIDRLYSIGYKNRKNITVYGDVGENLGAYMKSGTIILNGDAGDSVGYYASGGKILINGYYRTISLTTKSEIINNGILLYKDGKRVGRRFK